MAKLENCTVEIRNIDYPQTLAIRSLVLKPYLKPTECTNPGDFKVDSFHLGAFVDGVLVSIASLESEAHSDLPANSSFRLRGMATLPEFSRKGLGSLLVKKAEEILRKQNIELLWFNARIAAFPFYESLEYLPQDELFDIPRIGPHKVMYKYLSTR